MKIIKLSLLLLVLFSQFNPIRTFAAKLENLPSTEASKQWKVVIGKADSKNPKHNVSDKTELYNVYSMDIKNIGDENVQIVRIEAFRDEPNSTKEYELFTVDNEKDKNLQPSFHHNNFPLYTKATQLKVIVTWTDKNDNSIHPRKFREQFLFQQ